MKKHLLDMTIEELKSALCDNLVAKEQTEKTIELLKTTINLKISQQQQQQPPLSVVTPNGN